MHNNIEPLVYIVIPVKERLFDLIECIGSIKQQTYTNYKIVVVDNNSKDRTKEEISKIYPEIELISLEDNYGASYASNIGFSYSLRNNAELVLRLDSDAILDKNYLSELVKSKSKLPKAELLSGTIFSFYQPERVWFTGGFLTKWNLSATYLHEISKNSIQHRQYYEVDFLPSTGILISSNTIKELKGFDQDYLVYYEDFDLCLRAAKSGNKLFYIPNAKMWHKVYSNKQTAWVAKQWNKSKVIFYRKHANNNLHLGLLIIYAILYAIVRSIFFVENKGNRGPFISTLKGIIEGLLTPINKK
jgi:GT2 family glycosyltransferase